MRLLLLVALVALAGCAVPTEDAQDPLFGWCPQWEPGPGMGNVTVLLDANTTTVVQDVSPMENGSLVGTYHGHVLDVYRVRIVAFDLEAGQLEMRGVSAGVAVSVRDYSGPDARLEPSVRWAPDADAVDRQYDLLLHPLDAEDITAQGLQLEWRLRPDGAAARAEVTVEVTPLYRVCGAL